MAFELNYLNMENPGIKNKDYYCYRRVNSARGIDQTYDDPRIIVDLVNQYQNIPEEADVDFNQDGQENILDIIHLASLNKSNKDVTLDAIDYQMEFSSQFLIDYLLPFKPSNYQGQSFEAFEVTSGFVNKWIPPNVNDDFTHIKVRLLGAGEDWEYYFEKLVL